MQKVGMSNKEIRKSIHFQVLSVFFLPLLVAVMHYGFAFKMITQLLALFQLSNTNLFLLCSVATIVIFIVFYSIVYFFTSKAYYKIIK
jgi:putative ABC transport system permease protein